MFMGEYSQTIAVSYTHLDVYKRQHKGRLAGCLPVWYFCGSRTDTGDVTDDRNNLPCERCRFHE